MRSRHTTDHSFASDGQTTEHRFARYGHTPPSSSPPTPTMPTMPTPISTSVDELRAEIEGGRAGADERLDAVTSAALDADIERLRSTIEELRGWVVERQEAARSVTVSDCIDRAHQTYVDGLGRLHGGTIDFGIMLIGGSAPSADDVERTFGRLTDGAAQLARAELLLDGVTCDESPPTPSASVAMDPVEAYAVVAREFNAVWATAGSAEDARDDADALLRAQEAAVSRLGTLASGSDAADEVAALVAAAEEARLGLRAAAVAPNHEDSRRRLQLLTLTSLLAQREAAAEVRKALGLPPQKDGEIL